jgi:hypothetical protein
MFPCAGCSATATLDISTKVKARKSLGWRR